MNKTKQQITFSAGCLFLKDAEEKGVAIKSVTDIEVANGLFVHFAAMQFSPLVDAADKAIFGFFPYEDHKPYIQLTFLPDYNNVASTQAEIVQINFFPAFFEQWNELQLSHYEPFSSDRSVEQQFSYNANIRHYLSTIVSFKNSERKFLDLLQLQSVVLSLLKIAIESFVNPDEATILPACGFLNNSTEREKIFLAQKTILDNISEPLTIKELARICAINECYLKKGFKAIFGKTIYEYREQTRIEMAKDLILNNQYNINEVADRLGYASHSYFSTVFKRITGIKPCDLLK